MFILGVNTGPHDGSAALLHDGALVVMAEQERISRRKQAFGESPSAAIRACLDTAGISLSEVTEVAVGWDVPYLSKVENHRRNLVRLNTIKGREIWRPLAPSVLAEHVTELFGQRLPSPADFMLCAWPVIPEARRLIPAAVHVDGSARPQVVSRAASPRFWAVIDAFRRRTGVPAVINTSFNPAGEPNVLSAGDAVACFRRGGLDVLAIGDYLVENPAPAPAVITGRHPAVQPEMTFTPWNDG